MDSADDLLEIFAGSERRHGTWKMPASDTSGKKTIRRTARTLDGPATADLWRAHLEGRKELGVVPARGDQCMWGAIDVDGQPNHRALSEHVKRLDLPLMVERSKSGGAHLILFMSEWTPVTEMRAALKEMLPLLSLPEKTEVFPKQVETDDTDANWMCMPYFGGDDLPMQLGYTADYRAMSVHAYIQRAKQLRTSRADLSTIRAEFSDHADDHHAGSPAMTSEEAIRHLRNLADEMEQAGDGHRNNTLNSVAFRAGALVEANLVKRETARDVLTAAAQRAGLEAGEIDGVLDRAMQDGAKRGSVPTSGFPDRSMSGMPRATLRNTMVAIERLGLVCRHNAFKVRDTINGYQMDAHAGEVADRHVTIVRSLILDSFRFDPGKEHVRDAIGTLALKSQFDPVCDYLASLTWDGVPRIATMLSVYFGAADTPLNRAISNIMMVGAVRRPRHPGCKLDTIPILESPQGTNKSTAIRMLAGDGFFSDAEILAVDPKTQMEQIEGIWLYEIAELDGMQRADVEKVKAFASRQVDRARPAYGRNREDRPRRGIFIGTTNGNQYLRDPTGNRRFLPVKVGRIDLETLERDRDLLWAEAAHMEETGFSTVLPEELWRIAAIEQDSRVADDPWMDALRHLRTARHGDKLKVFTSTIYTLLNMDAERQTQATSKRIADCMRRLGWEGPLMIRINGEHRRGFQREPDGNTKDNGSATEVDGIPI